MKIIFTKPGKKSYKNICKKSKTDGKIINGMLSKLSDENYINSPHISKVEKCKKGIVFRFETGNYRIFFGRNIAKGEIYIYLISKKSGNKTYNEFDCP